MPELTAYLARQELARGLSLGALVAARVLPLILFLPWMSMRGLSPLLRTLIAVTLALALAPIALSAASEPGIDALSIAPALLREVVVGVVFALSAALPIHALEWGGALVDGFRGASLAEVRLPGSIGATTPLGALYRMLGVAVFLTLGGHRLVLSAFAETFITQPIGASFGDGSLLEVSLGASRLVGAALGVAAGVAAPAALLLVLGELSLALLGRAAPQVQVFFLGMPLRAGLGIFATLLGLGVLMSRWPVEIRGAMDSAGSLIEALAG